MYNTTTALASALATQKLYTKVVYGSTTIGAEQVKKCVYSGSFGGANTATIGGVTAAMVTLTLSGAHNLMDKTITVSVGADVSGTVQYVPLGTFVVATCKQVDDTTTVTAYDAAYYALGGTYIPNVSSGATVAAVLSDVAAQCGLTLATLPAAASTTSVVGDLTGKTCRDMVGYLAALVGCNALIDRDGKLALRWFASSGQSYSPSDYYNAGLSIDGTSTLACIQATAEETTTDADGNTSVTTNTYTAGGTGVGIAVQNPYMTQAILDAVWASIGGLAYTVGSCDIFHGLLTEPGDLVTITDKAGVAHTLAVMSLTMTIDGGCKTTLWATGESTTDASAAMQGSLGGKVSQLVVDLAKVKQLIIEDVNGVTKIYGGRIDTKSLFAQDITATGTITGARLKGAELDCSRTEGSKNYTCAMKNGKVEAAYQDNLLDGGDKERYAVTVNKDAATALEIEHIYDSATNGVSKQRTIVDADSIRVGDKSTGNDYNSPLDTKGMYVKRDGLYAWDYLNLKVGDILNEYVSLLRYASCDTQDADKEKLILGDKAAGVRVWGNEDFSTLDDASAILANTKWVTDKLTTVLAAVLADYALASDIPTKLPANGGRADSAANADNASKLLGLIVGNRWGDIPKIGTDGVMEIGKYLDFHSSDNADSTDYDARITCNGDVILIPKLSVDKITDNSYSTNTYTSFSGSVLSSGSVTVTKKLGMCWIKGTLTLSNSISSWATILNSSAIPAPQDGVLLPFDASQWGTSYARTLRGRIPAGGGLQLVYGAAGSYVINIGYPIE